MSEHTAYGCDWISGCDKPAVHRVSYTDHPHHGAIYPRTKWTRDYCEYHAQMVDIKADGTWKESWL